MKGKLLLLLALAGMLCAGERATYYVRDVNGNVLVEYDENGEIKHVNLYGDELLGKMIPDGAENVKHYHNGNFIRNYRSLNGAILGLQNDEYPDTGDSLVLECNNEEYDVVITQSNVVINAGDSSGVGFSPKLVYGSYDTENEKTYNVFSDSSLVENVLIDGLAIEARTAADSATRIRLRGDDITFRNTSFKILKQ